MLHEAARRLGYGAEIAATVQEEAFWHLDQPVLRIGAKNTPTPTSPPLEDAVVPQPAEIAARRYEGGAESMTRLRHRRAGRWARRLCGRAVCRVGRA